MPAGTADLTAEQGATFYQKLTLKDNTATLIDLTGDTFRGKVKKKISATDTIVSFTCVVLDQSTNTGEVEISLTPTQTAAIVLRKQNGVTRTNEEFCYDIERVISGGAVQRIMQGKFLVSPEVTT